MTVNYYVRVPDTCGGTCTHHCYRDVHLGQSAAGWAFMFRGYHPGRSDTPEQITWTVNDYASWNRLLDLGPVFDGYGKKIEPNEMRKRVADMAFERAPRTRQEADMFDEEKNAFCFGEFR